MPAEEAIEQVGASIREQHPHDADVPGDPTGQPPAQGHPAGKREGQARRRVVNGPAAQHHAKDRDGTDPMHDPDR